MKNRHTAIIIDDELRDTINLSDSLRKAEKIELIGTAQNAKAGKEIILKMKPDLIFLDIEMPYINGIEMLREMKDAISWHLHVIFYTAYNKYLLEALRESAFDYLLKPYTEYEFELVINRFLKHIESSPEQAPFRDSAPTLYTKENSHFLITTIKGYISLKANDIGYFEYIKERRHWMVILEEQAIQLKKNTSAEDILKLDSAFTQINQQQIINIFYLRAIEGKRCVMTPPFEKASNLVISRFFFSSVQERFLML
ncbi:response regulator [uncultured Bacteroides sp.]|uniref:LytR/AlgR family response regulator transcription factor n=1 Tax=uncultured Bacteroides sp. TaxID=162156 RepID=UPI002AA875C8|nr:response regulator [uncultured Bacteroides sp.]